mmetsp:Transcript_84123/g.162349  ORF Transcript_84123/g.162349 Transcript_84123/m.162349 type:complete len:590 (-) Transcript_84123:271-2040(-)
MEQDGEEAAVANRPTFWQLITDLGAEHDRQLTGLLTLVRELRVELTDATECDNRSSVVANLRLENLELRKQLANVQATPQPGAQLHAQPMVAMQGQVQDGVALAELEEEWLADSMVSQKVEEAPGVGMRGVMTSFGTSPSMGKGAEDCVREDARKNTTTTESLAKAAAPESKHEEHDKADLDKPAVARMQRFSASLQHLVDSPGFEAFVGFLIVTNTLVMMLESQYLGLLSGYRSGIPGIGEDARVTWRGADKAFLIIDRAFTVIFAVELLVRFIALRCALFKTPLNWIDIAAVFVSVLQWAVEEIPVNPTILRLVRVARLVRGIRFLKLSKVLASLNILIRCMRASVNILFWSLCLLMMIQCITGMVTSQLAQEYIVNLANPEDKRHELFLYYGTFTRSFITMFEIHMANWATPCRIFLETLGEIWGDLLVFYRCIMGFALMNVIGAVFVQQTMAVAQNDNDIMILKKQKEAENYNNKLKSLFATLDKDQDGMLSRDEFDEITQDLELKSWMRALEIDPEDLSGLFDLLDTGDGNVSMDDFMMGATRMRGPARSIDVAHLLTMVGRLERMMAERPHGAGEGGKAAVAK